MHRFRDGDTIDVLADALDDLRQTLHGVRAINFTGDSRDIVEYAANLFGPSKPIANMYYGVFFFIVKSTIKKCYRYMYKNQKNLLAHFLTVIERKKTPY